MDLYFYLWGWLDAQCKTLQPTSALISFVHDSDDVKGSEFFVSVESSAVSKVIEWDTSSSSSCSTLIASKFCCKICNS
jgi:hypothetical protein